MNLNRMIDHTMLKADATKETIIRYCREAKEHEFASVCVNTCFVPLVADELNFITALRSSSKLTVLLPARA